MFTLLFLFISKLSVSSHFFEHHLSAAETCVPCVTRPPYCSCRAELEISPRRTEGIPLSQDEEAVSVVKTRGSRRSRRQVTEVQRYDPVLGGNRPLGRTRARDVALDASEGVAPTTRPICQ